MNSSARTTPEISILIVNWNCKEYTNACLSSIYRYPPQCSFEIIVVDGGSFDGCGRMIEAQFENTIFIQSNSNIGFARSNNLGYKQCKGKTLILLNPDTEIQPNSLDQLIYGLKSNPKAGAVGPRLLNSDKTLQTSSVLAFPTTLNQLLDSQFFRFLFPKSNLWKNYNAYHNSQPTEVEAISGACIVIPSYVYQEVGGFDSDYFMYAEDIDLCFKVRKLGYKIFHQPNSHIIHHGGGSSSSQPSKFSSIMKRESLHTYIKKQRGVPAAIRYRIAIAISSLTRILLLSISIIIMPKNRVVKHSLLKWLYAFSWAIGKENSAKNSSNQ